MADTKVTTTGPGLGTLLGLLFITLKLLGKISWSWWWVLSPFWIGWAIFFTILLIPFVIAAVLVVVVGIIDWWQDRTRRRQSRGR